jgi:hypothetical protein
VVSYAEEDGCGHTDQDCGVEQPDEQRVLLMEHDRQGWDQFGVSPPQCVRPGRHDQPGDSAGGARSGDAFGGTTGRDGSQECCCQQRAGEHVGQPALAGVDYRGGRAEQHQWP